MEKQPQNSRMFPRLKTLWRGLVEGHKYFRLCSLDWSPVESVGYEEYQQFRGLHPGNDVPHLTKDELYACESRWNRGLDECRFLLSPNYAANIRWDVHRAQDVWNYERGLDTMMRDICVEPGASHTYVAFRLLADCLVDRQSADKLEATDPANDLPAQPPWSKHATADNPLADRPLLTSVMLARFWFGQTGRGHVVDNSRIVQVIDRCESLLASDFQLFNLESVTVTHKHALEFKTYLEDHVEKYGRHVCYVVNESGAGPKAETSAPSREETENNVKGQDPCGND